MASARCSDCGKEYRTTAAADEGLCQTCKGADDEMYANDPTPVHAVEYQPWRWSQAAMKDRLGVTGNVDE